MFIWAPNVFWFTVAAAVFGLTTGIAGPAPQAYVADLAGGRNIGARLGVYRSFGDLGFIVGPICVGVLSDTYGYNASLLVNAVLIIASGVLFAVVAKETGGRRLRAALATAASTASTSPTAITHTAHGDD